MGFVYKIHIFIFVSLLSLNIHAATDDAVKTIHNLEAREQKTVTLPNVSNGKLKNSFKYYLLSDHELPIVKAVIYIKGGSVYDPSGKSGLAAFTASMLLRGGTSRLTPDELDKKLDMMASDIQIETSDEYMTAALSCRSEHFEKTLNIALDMLFRPRFDEKRFELIKKRFKNSIKRRGDSPNALASLGFSRLLYSFQNPWGVYPTTSSVDAISIEDIKNLHKNYFHPANMIIGVSGDVRLGSVLDILKSYDGYPDGKAADLIPPKANPKPVSGVHIIDKDTSQVVFNAGQQGGYRFNPDKYNLIIMNDILGGSGSFKNRLPALIRVEKGLAYTVYSSYRFGPKEAPGMFKIYMSTKTKSALEAMELIRSELDRFVEGFDITDDELKRSKEAILRRLVFEYAAAYDIVSSMVRFNYFGYPDNYIEEYGKKIAEVKLDAVKRAAKRYLHPKTMQFVLVGDKAKLEKLFKDKIKFSELSVDE